MFHPHPYQSTGIFQNKKLLFENTLMKTFFAL